MNPANNTFADETERTTYLEQLVSGKLPAQPTGQRLLHRLLNPAVRGPFLETLLRQSLSVVETFIADMTATADYRAVAVLAPLLHSIEEAVVLAVISALGELGSPAARPALAERVEYDQRLVVRRAAAQVLDRLTDDSADLIEEIDLPLQSAYLTIVDGAGAQMALIARQWGDRDVASFHVIFDETQGIQEAFGVPSQAPLEFVDMLDDLEDDGLTPVEVPLSQIRADISHAYQRTLEEHGRVSVTFAAWESFVAGDDPRDIPSVDIPGVDLRTGFEVFTECQHLLDLDEFGTWYFEPDEISRAIDELRRLQRRRGESDYEGQLVGLIRKTLSGLVKPEHRELFRRRLERQAPLLMRIYDDPVHARRTLAAAAGLAGDAGIPVTEHPLLQEMLVRSLEDSLGRPLIDE